MYVREGCVARTSLSLKLLLRQNRCARRARSECVELDLRSAAAIVIESVCHGEPGLPLAPVLRPFPISMAPLLPGLEVPIELSVKGLPLVELDLADVPAGPILARPVFYHSVTWKVATAAAPMNFEVEASEIAPANA